MIAPQAAPPANTFIGGLRLGRAHVRLTLRAARAVFPVIRDLREDGWPT